MCRTLTMARTSPPGSTFKTAWTPVCATSLILKYDTRATDAIWPLTLTWMFSSRLISRHSSCSVAFNPVPLNPGNPYLNSRTENGFGTFGPPDFAATMAAVATKALNAVWYQKWFVHLRPRPEAIGGIVHLLKTGQGNNTDVRLSNVILNSQGLQTELQQVWLLPTFAGVPRRLTCASLLSHRARHRCGSMHHRAEVFL